MDEHVRRPLPARPYRSHRIPACEHCRKRKIRCNIDIPGKPCRFCRERNDTCNYTQKTTGVTVPLSRSPKRPRQNYTSTSALSLMGTEKSPAHSPNVDSTSLTKSSLMMNPPMAEDIAVLEQYLSSRAPEGRAPTKPYSMISNAPGNPIIYLSIPQLRKGVKTVIDPGRTQRDIVEQILGPYTSEVRKLYFDHVHPCFPIVDEKTFSSMWQRDDDRISSTLICDLYALTLLFWNRSEVLRHLPRPNLQFMWNQAVAALQDDFTAPTISTVHAALLDLTGRPVVQITENIMNAGRVVTLAHSLGLHRDPTLWKSTTHEKNVRTRLWWGVLIHDYWSSICHGIPPSIDRRCYDVPVPTLDSLLAPHASADIQQVTSSFLHLCRLSQILGDLLPFVYSLQLDVDELGRNLRKVECALDDWVEGLPQHLRLSQSLASVNGSSNLWFLYLSVKMLICRLAFKAALKDAKQTGPEVREYRLSMLREAASDVADFITSLVQTQLTEFWMPYTSYLLVSTATVLLRCTVECDDHAMKSSCIKKLVQFRDRLHQAQTESNWDLADFCLERCHEPIQRFADDLRLSLDIRPPPPLLAAANTLHTEITGSQPEPYERLNPSMPTPDVLLPIDSLDFPWGTMWDNIDGPWPIQI